MLERAMVHIPDYLADPEATWFEAQRVGQQRTLLGVPLLRDGALIGVLGMGRDTVRPFSVSQIELVNTFADQAVIAVENARLLNELRQRTTDLSEALEQQTATSDVLQVISISPGHLEPVFAAMVEKAVRICEALFGNIYRWDGDYAGDGVMVIFNDPVPVENPALQAVLMALEMRGAIGALTDRWRRLGHDIGFGIGIAHGFATLGTIGFEGRFDYAAIGTVSNVASRLCDEVKPGQILISPRVLMTVEDNVTVEPVGEFALKGIRRPLAAYNVLASNTGIEVASER